MNVVEQRRHLLFTKRVVAAACDHYCGVDWEVTHLVAKPLAGRLASCLDANEFALDYFAVHCDRLKIPQLVRDQFTILKLATKVVNSVLNLVRL